MFKHQIDEDTALCLIEPQHAEQLNALIERNGAHIKEWSAWMKDDHSIENTRSFIKRNLTRVANNEGFAVAIWYQGHMAGQIEYNYIDWTNKKTEIGYWLGASFQGKGLAEILPGADRPRVYWNEAEPSRDALRGRE